MVSFWPWKGDESSPASFEKALSALSTKILKSSGKLDNLRQRSRRISVLWTLYAGFAYLLYTIILGLVVGWRQWGPAEYAAVVGGPLVIYLIRLGVTTYYDYRTSNVQGHLNELQAQRDVTIEKLKAATRYDSTQELLKKYGGTPTPKAKAVDGSDRKSTAKKAEVPKGARTSFVPPPTANIPQRDGLSTLQTTAQRSTPQNNGYPVKQSLTGGLPSPPKAISPNSPSAEFAPNAFSAPAQYAQANDGSRWYDRIMDVLLGEDETRPGARLALICNSCRLVNGQAPPGVKRLEDLGKWRCGGCGALNGEETEDRKIVASLKEHSAKQPRHRERKTEHSRKDISPDSNDDAAPTSKNEDRESDVTQYSTEDSGEDEEAKEMTEVKNAAPKPVSEADTPRRRSTRPTKGKKT